MSKEKSAIRNTFSYGTYSAVTTLAMFLLYLVAARFLGVEDFGRFSFAVAFVTLFAPLLDPGLYYLLIREIARRKELAGRYLAHTLTWKILSAPLVFAAVFVIVVWLHDSRLTIEIVCLMAVSQILHSWKDAFRPILLAHEMFNLDALSLAIERFSLLLLVSLVLIGDQGLLTVGWVFIIVRVIDLAIIALIVQFKVCGISLGRDLAFVRRIVLDAIPIGAFYMTLSVYNYIDTVMLSVLATNQDVGWYSASYKIYEGPILIPAIFGTVFLPRLSRLYIEHRDSFMGLFERGLKYVILASIVVATNGILLSEVIVLVSFGDDYMNSIVALEILLAGLAFVFTINFLQTVMISIDRQAVILKITLLGLAMNVLFNMVLIPRYGYIGAAIATISVEGIVCIIMCVALHRVVAKVHWWKVWFKPVIGGVLALASTMAVTGIYLQLLVLNGVFVLLLLLTGIIGKQEISALTRWIGKTRLPGDRA